jgi:hypothetical protein
MMRDIDRSFDDLFRGIGVIPIQFIAERRSWQGSTLTFSLAAKVGLLSAPVKGTIEVTERDLTIDLDLGLLGRLIPATKAREALSGRIRGLLT